ncbi:hypothetical protein B0H17DRAFT_1129176 [Mycena rosella]|uniref:Reverse transcriptase zinc-binding domain-containing protein n=1 Tax=Mycena rosella TaxID=1033263 RepID=A0AAD7DTR3_MYCRO|nr:hypothetical protein B0H17DRAFT_1129176 [Mycena rosella]
MGIGGGWRGTLGKNRECRGDRTVGKKNRGKKTENRADCKNTFNVFLHRFHLGPSPHCDLYLVPETVSHFLLACPLYWRQRLGTARLTLRRLIGVKSDPRPALSFVRETGRLPRYAL